METAVVVVAVGGTAEIVEIEEEIVVVRRKQRLQEPLHLGVSAIEAPSIRISRLESGKGAPCTSDSGARLIFVTNPGLVH